MSLEKVTYGMYSHLWPSHHPHDHMIIIQASGNWLACMTCCSIVWWCHCDLRPFLLISGKECTLGNLDLLNNIKLGSTQIITTTSYDRNSCPLELWIKDYLYRLYFAIMGFYIVYIRIFIFPTFLTHLHLFAVFQLTLQRSLEILSHILRPYNW